MKAIRWRVRTLLGLIVVVAVIGKGMLIVEEWVHGAPRRRAAIAELARTFPRPASVEPTLVAALDDRDGGVRYTALCALVMIGSNSTASVRPLVAMLEEETEEPHYDTVFYVPPPPIRRAGDALKRIKPPAAVVAPMLRAAMASPHPWTRLQATEVLCDAAGRPGPPAPDLAPMLLAALRDREPAIRMPVPEALARLDADARQKAVAILLEQLREPDRPTQLLAAVGLARFDPEGRAAAAVLADRLRASDAAARLSAPAPEPPARTGVPEITIRMVTPGEPGQEVGGLLGARLLDLYLLGRLGPVARPAVPEVVRAMTARDAGENVPFFLGAFETGRRTWYSSVINWGLLMGETGQSFSNGAWNSIPVDWALNSGEGRPLQSSLCRMGAAVLGRIGPEAEREAVDLLIGMLRGGDESQALGAADALGALGPRASEAFPALLAQAEREKPGPPGDGDWHATSRLTTALTKVCAGDDPRLVAALIRLLTSIDPTKRAAAATTLGQLEHPAPAAVPALREARHDPEEFVRDAAEKALAAIAPSEATNPGDRG